MIKFGRPLFNHSIDGSILAILAAAATWSSFSLPRLRIDPGLSASLAESVELRECEEAAALFPDEHLVLVSLPCGDLFSPSSMARLEAFSTALEMGQTEGAWKLYSPTTVETFARRGEEIVSTPIHCIGEDSQATRSRLASSALLSRLFVSSDGSAWTLLLSVRASDPELLSRLDAARAAFPEIRIAGQPYYSAINRRILSREFVPLILGSAAILLAMEILILRSLGPAILLWAFSLFPSLLLLGLFVFTGTPMRLHYMLAPALTLSLSNSYVTHLYRGWAEGGLDPRAAFRSRAKIVLLDALTTVLGFGSLFASPVRELAILGAFSIAGAIFSVIGGLVGLPAALGFVGRPSSAALRLGVSKGDGIRPPGRRRLRVVAWATACAVLAFFSLRLESGFEARDQFLPWSAHGRETVYFENAYNGLEEISLIVRTGRENGYVDLGLFRSLDALQSDIAALPGVGAVYGPNDLVKEVLARWEGGASVAEEPRDEADIGESLQLLSNAGGGIFSRGFVEPNWSSVKIRISVSPGFKAVSDFPRLKEEVNAIVRSRSPGVRTLWGGDIVMTSIQQRAFIKGQVDGGLGFLVLLFIGLCLVFRSIPRAFAVSIVPLTGFLASLGLMGILGWRLSPVHAIALATVAGTGVDNAIVLVLRGWSAEARDAIVDTTVLIIFSMASLLFCTSYLIVQTTIICLAGLAASTAVATIVLPALQGGKGK